MITTIHFEEFASGMKAKLDPTYRQALQSRQHLESAEIRWNLTRGNHRTVLPFTTVTKSYGTFERREY
jgi:hypothetical protein